MNWKNIRTVYCKELTDSLRDRRTLISMIVIPTVAIPLILLAVAIISVKVVKKVQSTKPTIALVGGLDSPVLHRALEDGKEWRVVPAGDDWRSRIADKKLGAAVEIPEGFEEAVTAGLPARVRIYNYSGEMKSGFAVEELQRFLRNWREKIVAARLAERGLQPELVKPFDVRTENVAPPAKVGGNAVGGFIPYMFLILCFSAAIYPAIDLTAGEKERGTMETILCSPVARVDLVMGKFLMVLTASLGTVACSLISMGATMAGGGALMMRMLGDPLKQVAAAAAQGGKPAFVMPSLDPLGLLGVVAMVLPMAALFAALLLAISLVARSFKEAQSYTSPMVIVIILPAIIGLLPGVDLNTPLSFVPILNVSLVSKDMVSGVFNWQHIGIIFGSSCAYAAAALAFCVRQFNREQVIFRT